jgi:hypothetical protein
MDRLDPLRARSRDEIAAHAGDLDKTDTGRYVMGEASELLAALRLWALSSTGRIKPSGWSSRPATLGR